MKITGPGHFGESNPRTVVFCQSSPINLSSTLIDLFCNRNNELFSYPYPLLSVSARQRNYSAKQAQRDSVGFFLCLYWPVLSQIGSSLQRSFSLFKLDWGGGGTLREHSYPPDGKIGIRVVRASWNGGFWNRGTTSAP